jgi:hypothetical protein
VISPPPRRISASTSSAVRPGVEAVHPVARIAAERSGQVACTSGRPRAGALPPGVKMRAVAG